MAFHYHTEYRLGGRFGRISRSYTGVHAFLAIVLDLFLEFLFALVSIVIGLAMRAVVLALQISVFVLIATWNFLIAAMTLVVFCITIPFTFLAHVLNRRRFAFSQPKPEWALSREV